MDSRSSARTTPPPVSPSSRVFTALFMNGNSSGNTLLNISLPTVLMKSLPFFGSLPSMHFVSGILTNILACRCSSPFWKAMTASDISLNSLPSPAMSGLSAVR